MVPLAAIHRQLEHESGVIFGTNKLINMLYRWNKRYNSRELNMFERKRQAGEPFLYHDEVAPFKSFALTQLHKDKIRYERMMQLDANYDLRMLAHWRKPNTKKIKSRKI